MGGATQDHTACRLSTVGSDLVFTVNTNTSLCTCSTFEIPSRQSSYSLQRRLPYTLRAFLHSLLGCLIVLTTGISTAEDMTAQSEVVAKVGNVSITRQVLDLAWERMAPPDSTPEKAAVQRKALLAELVRMEALAQRAEADNLDSSPTYVAELVVAQRKVLASLVERRVVANAPTVTPAQVRMVIESNPQAFRDRQLLTIEELTIPLPGEPLRTQLVDASQQGESFQSMEKRLEQAQVRPLRRVYTVGSDQLKIELLKSLMDAKADEAVMVKRGSDQLQIMVMRTSTPAPLTDESATLIATAKLNAQLRQHAIQQHIQKVLNETDIAYFGEFTQLTHAVPAATDAATSAPPNQIAALSVNDAANKALPQEQSQSSLIKRWRRVILAGLVVAAGALAMLQWVMMVRQWIGTLWLPFIWPQRRPKHSPTLAAMWAKHFLARSNQRFTLQQRLHGWLVMSPALLSAVMFWRQLQDAQALLSSWKLALCLGTGLLLGVGASHVFARSRWRAATRLRLWLPLWLVSLGLLTVTGIAALVL